MEDGNQYTIDDWQLKSLEALSESVTLIKRAEEVYNNLKRVFEKE